MTFNPNSSCPLAAKVTSSSLLICQQSRRHLIGPQFKRQTGLSIKHMGKNKKQLILAGHYLERTVHLEILTIFMAFIRSLELGGN